jgi:hypothetical protein
MPVQSHFLIETIKGYDAQREGVELASIFFASNVLAPLNPFRAAWSPVSNRYFGFLWVRDHCPSPRPTGGSRRGPIQSHDLREGRGVEN